MRKTFQGVAIQEISTGCYVRVTQGQVWGISYPENVLDATSYESVHDAMVARLEVAERCCVMKSHFRLVQVTAVVDEI